MGDARGDWRRTLCEDEVVLLDEGLEVVLVQLLDVGAGSDSREEGGADGGVPHLGGEICVNGGLKRVWVESSARCRKSAEELGGGPFIRASLWRGSSERIPCSLSSCTPRPGSPTSLPMSPTLSPLVLATLSNCKHPDPLFARPHSHLYRDRATFTSILAPAAPLVLCSGLSQLDRCSCTSHLY
jgi:hypothetical protein